MPRDRIGRTIRRYGIFCRVAFFLLSGPSVFPPPAAVLAQDVPVAHPLAAHRFVAHIAEASQRFRVPEAWISAVLNAESAQDTRAVSDAGAMGLMQIMPDTWEELRVRYSFGDDAFDPRDNILTGTAYLREMLDRYGNVGAMLAAYNAGPRRYDEYLTASRPLPAETRDYVAKLAPVLGGEPLPGGASLAPPHPTDWREAPLFVAPASSSASAGSLHPGGQPDAPVTAEPARDDDTARVPREGILVVRSGEVSSP